MIKIMDLIDIFTHVNMRLVEESQTGVNSLTPFKPFKVSKFFREMNLTLSSIKDKLKQVRVKSVKN